MFAEPVIFFALFGTILASVIILQKKNRKMLNRVVNALSQEHYPEHVWVSSKILREVILHFDLRYQDVDLNSNLWNDSGYRRSEPLVRDLSDIVSDVCGHELQPAMFERCETISDVIAIAIQQNKKPNKAEMATPRKPSDQFAT